MKRFIDFVSQYDPNFPAKIRGASPTEIGQLEQLVGYQLPAFYRDYLSYLGHNHGGINIAFEASADIGSVIEYYQESILSNMQELPQNSIVIAAYGSPLNQISLQFNDSSTSEEPIVNLSDGAEIESFYAESLEKLLYQVAYLKYQPNLFSISVSYTSVILPRGTIDERAKIARQVVLELGFEQRWFSGTVIFCADRKNEASIWIVQAEDGGPTAKISAWTRQTVEEIGQLLVERAGMKISKNNQPENKY